MIMASLDLFLIILTIFMLVLALFLANRWIPKDAASVPELAEIPKFYADVHFDPYPSVVNIENKYDCNASSLRVCDINDNTTLFGCKELTVRCRHFDKDTKYISNGEEKIIPKNRTPTEGYALAITTLTEACNAYHGDLVLVAANRESTEYMMICSCKNPGYIGNENLLGNCTDVFVCNGKVDNIDQPFEKIKCVCDRGMTSVNTNGVPVCKTMTVKDANESYSNWTNLIDIPDGSALPLNEFNATIRDNMKVDRLLNPCTQQLTDPTKTVSGGRYAYYKKMCEYNDGGLPIHIGALDTKGVADAILPTGPYRYLRFTDNVGGIRQRAVVNTQLKFLDDQTVGLVLLPDGIAIGDGDKTQLTFPMDNAFISPKCTGGWPSYTCKLEESIGASKWGLPMPTSRECPSSFLWNREYWTDAEFLVPRSIYPKTDGLVIDQTDLVKAVKGNFYGVAYANKNINAYRTGLLKLNNDNDYKLHKNSIT